MIVQVVNREATIDHIKQMDRDERVTELASLTSPFRS
jgi:hypothetical protein